jgi:hypothetical protein
MEMKKQHHQQSLFLFFFIQRFFLVKSIVISKPSVYSVKLVHQKIGVNGHVAFEN